MCVSPIKVPNKNHFSQLDIRERMIKKVPYKNYTDLYIEVPCGHCDECIRAKQDAIVQRVNMESRKNHLFLCTLTYQSDYLPSVSVNGHDIRYADVRDVQLMMKRLRKDNAFGIPFRYLAVSELGSRRGRPHFHILFMFSKEHFPKEKSDYIAACDSFASKAEHFFTPLNYWQRNYGSRRNPDYRPLCKYKEVFINHKRKSNYDFHYVNPFLTANGVEDCGYYVLKYMFKPSDRAERLQQALKLNLSEADYRVLWSLVRPRWWSSLGFGLNASGTQLKQSKFVLDEYISDKILKDIKYSKQFYEFPSFVHPVTGKNLPLSPYYKHHFLTHQDRIDFWFFKKNGRSADNSDPKDQSKVKSFTQLNSHSIRYEKTQKHLDELGFDSELDLLE